MNVVIEAPSLDFMLVFSLIGVHHAAPPTGCRSDSTASECAVSRGGVVYLFLSYRQFLCGVLIMPFCQPLETWWMTTHVPCPWLSGSTSQSPCGRGFGSMPLGARFCRHGLMCRAGSGLSFLVNGKSGRRGPCSWSWCGSSGKAPLASFPLENGDALALRCWGYLPSGGLLGQGGRL